MIDIADAWSKILMPRFRHSGHLHTKGYLLDKVENGDTTFAQ